MVSRLSEALGKLVSAYLREFEFERRRERMKVAGAQPNTSRAAAEEAGHAGYQLSLAS